MAHSVKQKGASFSEGRFAPPDSVVVDQDGKPLRFVSDVARGYRLVISFFYADCKTICPVSNLIMAGVAKKAFSSGGKPVRLVSITVDPQRDSPDVLKAMAASVGEMPDWRWLTGSPTDVRALTHGLGLTYDAPEDHGVMFIVGDVDTGRFVSTSGMPDAAKLLAELTKISR